ncbi:MAG: hypothetical protein ACTFAL_06000 [Candidatus Electronema sp. V4]|uniref:hypothetical protein n=1 Tax=Candidatus Electronema sp. V4 TaxID=3454756 RepID=UPI004055436C
MRGNAEGAAAHGLHSFGDASSGDSPGLLLSGGQSALLEEESAAVDVQPRELLLPGDPGYLRRFSGQTAQLPGLSPAGFGFAVHVIAVKQEKFSGHDRRGGQQQKRQQGRAEQCQHDLHLVSGCVFTRWTQGGSSRHYPFFSDAGQGIAVWPNRKAAAGGRLSASFLRFLLDKQARIEHNAPP